MTYEEAMETGKLVRLGVAGEARRYKQLLKRSRDDGIN